MNAEELEFPDNSFDIVIDGGTFSSLRLDVALKEIARILKPEGTVIGIETLGHNPLTNIKRVWNVARGTRTKWAADHIFKMRDLNVDVPQRSEYDFHKKEDCAKYFKKVRPPIVSV